MGAASDAPFHCPSCDGDSIILDYTVPVFVFANAGAVARVVVADQDVRFQGFASCETCRHKWTPDAEPDFDSWPEWQVGS